MVNLAKESLKEEISSLSFSVKDILKQKKIFSLMEIQKKAIPIILSNKQNALFLAPTGSGKTLAYVLPILTLIERSQNVKVLVTLPTRDLAIQVHQVFREYIKALSLKTALLIGGTRIEGDFKNLKNEPKVIIGTPGRLLAHFESLKKMNFNLLVFDQVDRLLDIGFKKESKKIQSLICNGGKKIFFSATLSNEVKENLAVGSVQGPKLIDICSLYHENFKIQQSFLEVKDTAKYPSLVKNLKNSQSTVVFVNSKYRAIKLSKALTKDGFTAFSYTSRDSTNQRKKKSAQFKNTPNSCLVATDIAARGIDFKNLNLVLNYEVPFVPSDYIHRIGRTGRAFASGKAVTLYTKAEKKLLKNIQTFKKTNQQIFEPKLKTNKIKGKALSNNRKR